MIEDIRNACEQRYRPRGLEVEDGNAYPPSVRLRGETIAVCEIASHESEVAVYILGVLAGVARNRPRTFSSLDDALSFVDDLAPNL